MHLVSGYSVGCVSCVGRIFYLSFNSWMSHARLRGDLGNAIVLDCPKENSSLVEGGMCSVDAETAETLVA